MDRRIENHQQFLKEEEKMKEKYFSDRIGVGFGCCLGSSVNTLHSC